MIEPYKASYRILDAETGAMANVWSHDEHMWSIWSMSTPLETRGKGGARRVMQEVCDLLDAYSKEGRLIARSFVRDDLPTDLPTAALVAFYERFGFRGVFVEDDRVHMHRPAKERAS